MRRLGRGVVRLACFISDNRNLLFVLAAFGTLVGLSAVSGYWLFYRSAYVLGALIPVSFLWARLHARSLDVTVEGGEDRLQVGQSMETRVRLQSRSIFTKLWLELEDETDMPGDRPRAVITLPAHGVRNWKPSRVCSRRGVYNTGTIRLTTGDPFGLFRVRRTCGERYRLTVLPQPEDLPYFWSPSAQLPGEGTVRKRTHYVTPNASAVREYHPGDSYKRIHWRSTARLGRLMVKTFEMDPTSSIWIVLDLQRDVQSGEGHESTEEYGVRIAASLAYRFLQTNRMVGLIAAGKERVVLEPARGAGQYGRILDELAVAEAAGKAPLADLLQEEGRLFGRHSTVIVVTPSADEEWVTSMQTLQQQGARAGAVLLDAKTFDRSRLPGEPGEDLPTWHLRVCNIPSYVVPARSDISLMLGPAGIVDEPLERQKAEAV